MLRDKILNQIAESLGSVTTITLKRNLFKELAKELKIDLVHPIYPGLTNMQFVWENIHFCGMGANGKNRYYLKNIKKPNNFKELIIN